MDQRAGARLTFDLSELNRPSGLWKSPGCSRCSLEGSRCLTKPLPPPGSFSRATSGGSHISKNVTAYAPIRLTMVASSEFVMSKRCHILVVCSSVNSIRR